MRLPNIKTKTSNINKKQAWIIAGVTLLVVGAAAVGFLCLRSKSDKNDDAAIDDSSSDTSRVEIDYNQAVTSPDGTEFIAKYQQGDEVDFAVRFSNLTCEDDVCSNVGVIRLGDRTLKRGEDYEVRQGSIIVVLLNKLLEAIQAGRYNLTVELKQGDENLVVGVYITIENKTQTCPDNQTLEDGKCIDKKPEATSDTNAGSTSGNVSSTSNLGNPGHTGTAESNTNTGDTNKPSSSQSQPQPQPQPEPTSKAEFNLNDNFKVDYFGEQWAILEEDELSCVIGANGTCTTTAFGTCTVHKDGNILKKTNFAGSLGNATEAQVREEQRKATERGLKPWQGGGYTVTLNEEFCGICGLSCGRW